jgi:hypothetical protein
MLLSATLPVVKDPRARRRLKAQLDSMTPFGDPFFCWKCNTHGRSIESIAVVRETVRGDRATVTLALRLADGRVVKDRERLVYTSNGWFIGGA